ncbi:MULTISPECIES: hypothetical protein [Shewanella]|uniref:Uncharacterized protein n=1 Tax=Shewanella scandinavica TaxID=3063538 RepID=A0ABU3G323_9GAMM|nr:MULTISPECIES: hypothetical protein [Shewanella]MCS6211173.1 hypothetical protein [Shewanella baltica]MDT3282039.1 hypothetical protein [Shewanella sp. SP2S1-2]WAL80471.1 hypothetical protein OX890_10215 [Shewanella sp. DAU305]
MSEANGLNQLLQHTAPDLKDIAFGIMSITDFIALKLPLVFWAIQLAT